MRAPTCPTFRALRVPAFTRAEDRGRGRRRDHGATTGRTVHIHSLTTPDAALAGRRPQFIPRRRTMSGFGGWLPRMIITMSGRAGQMLEKSSVLGGTRDTYSSRFEKRGCLNWFGYKFLNASSFNFAIGSVSAYLALNKVTLNCPATGFNYDTIEYAPSVREWQVYLVQKAIDLRRR